MILHTTEIIMVDDPQKDTDDVPFVTAPHNNDQTSDGVNQNVNNPTVAKLHSNIVLNHVM